jgi:hypothetical protein
MCNSTGASLTYKVEFDLDDSTNVYTGGCIVTHGYSYWSSLGPAVLSSIGPGMFAARMTVTDVGPDPDQSQSQSYVVTVTTSGLTEPAEAPRRLAWVSELDVPGGSGQVVVNGRSAVFARPGRSDSAVPGRSGLNRFEAQLVDGGGPGTWRFEFGQTPSLRPGSLRILAGSVAQITADAIVFRLAGRSGERIVFTLETDR